MTLARGENKKAVEPQPNREVDLMYPSPQPTLKDHLVRTYIFDDQMVEENYDGLLREGKIQPMISKKTG